MIHLGDIKNISGAAIPPVDIITGGSPCQDLSVAGKREGLAGERSGLFMEQMRIVREMREATNGQYPRYMVWENVPGAFSSNNGEDFRAVLEEVAKIADSDAVIPGPPKGKWAHAGAIMGDGWSVAWRVHDAQFWGVPQRRKRISLVADYLGGGAPELLFERKGVSGDIEESRSEREGTSGDITEGVDETGGAFNQQAVMISETTEMTPKTDEKGVAFSLRSRDYKDPQIVCVENHPSDSRVKISEDGIVQTLSERMGTGGGNVPMVAEPLCVEMTSTKNTVIDDGISPTLTARMGTGGNQVNAIRIGNGQPNQSISGVCNTISARDYKMAQCVMTYQDITGTIDRDIHKGVNNQIVNNDMLIANDYAVRKLTPTECERLQGYPDGWTDIGDWTDSKGKKHKGDSDSPRYKALGNSIALPFWQWMAARMLSHIDHSPTMGSLFDGIGGFPLAYQRCGCEPVWASEIEEFCIAVTKKRFESSQVT